MTQVPLHLGPLAADGCQILRSGVRWLKASGQHVRAGEIFAYCNVSLEPTSARFSGPPAFADELELHVGFAARVSGKIVIDGASLRGGYLNVRGVEAWDPQAVIGAIEPDPGQDPSADPGRLRLLALAGRRMTALADVHAGLLAGWHGRSRGWWCEEGEKPLTLLSLGICDATGPVLGELCAFMEMFEAASDAAHMVFVPDHPLAPASPVLLDQLTRTPAQFEALAADLREHLVQTAPTGDDLMFAGTLLSTMQRNPIRDGYDVFTASGSARLGPADAVLLSLSAEPQSILRHRKLGYHVNVMRHHQAAAGPAIRAWLAEAFEPVRRSVDDVRRDLEALIDAMAKTTGARPIILNRMSSSGYENISSYLPFDAPMSDTLANIASKEFNLMLHDVADGREAYIVDVDAIAAEMGGAEHLPDGIHQSGPMQAVLRGEILGALNDMRQASALRAAVR